MLQFEVMILIGHPRSEEKALRENESEKPRFLDRMKRALGATKTRLVTKIESVLASRSDIDEDLFEELEAVLIEADIGIDATTEVLQQVRRECEEGILASPKQIRGAIEDQLLGILERADLGPRAPAVRPHVWMVVGVNGTGKTTTVGKLAARLTKQGKKVLVCAADTFRAAAIEQLSVWADRSKVELIKNRTGSDPSAVLHDALSAAVSRGCDVALVDTAGRIHTRGSLMKEIGKMRRVASTQIEGAPHEVLLVLDATTGQNGLVQAREFLKSTGVTGLVVTKLDGTAKGGVLFSVARELKIPVRYIGIGEALDDLVEFSPRRFVEFLFAVSSETQREILEKDDSSSPYGTESNSTVD